MPPKAWWIPAEPAEVGGEEGRESEEHARDEREHLDATRVHECCVDDQDHQGQHRVPGQRRCPQEVTELPVEEHDDQRVRGTDGHRRPEALHHRKVGSARQIGAGPRDEDRPRGHVEGIAPDERGRARQGSTRRFRGEPCSALALSLYWRRCDRAVTAGSELRRLVRVRATMWPPLTTAVRTARSSRRGSAVGCIQYDEVGPVAHLDAVAVVHPDDLGVRVGDRLRANVGSRPVSPCAPTWARKSATSIRSALPNGVNALRTLLLDRPTLMPASHIALDRRHASSDVVIVVPRIEVHVGEGQDDDVQLGLLDPVPHLDSVRARSGSRENSCDRG